MTWLSAPSGTRLNLLGGVNTTTYARDAADNVDMGSYGPLAAYTYNGDGMRATRTTTTGTQKFAFDPTSSVPRLLSDGAVSYLYDDGGNPLEQIDAAGVVLYYQHDQYGSTRLLTNATGAVAATFSYDPYGNLTGRTGTADTPLRWNGQYQDADTGLYYLRARYYDPATAQFLTRDPLEALTLAAYAFGGGNPLNMIDPLGLDWGWSEGLTSLAAVAGVAALVATGPVAIGLAGVAVVAGGGALFVDYANHEPGWKIALDAIAVIPGLGAFGADIKVGVAARDASMALSNIGKAQWWDIAAANYGFMSAAAIDANALTCAP